MAGVIRSCGIAVRNNFFVPHFGNFYLKLWFGGSLRPNLFNVFLAFLPTTVIVKIHPWRFPDPFRVLLALMETSRV